MAWTGKKPILLAFASALQKMMLDRNGLFTSILLTMLLWGAHIIWLSKDTRPPVWDMALHQTYAFNYLDDNGILLETNAKAWEKSGDYPPFVHWAIAAMYLIFHPGPHIARLANLPATFILFLSVFLLAKDQSGPRAGRWACVLVALTPFMIWISRETILDYWLSAWFAAALVVLRKTRGFQSHSWSLLLGAIMAMGLLTKWFFAGIILAPLLYVFVESKVWKEPDRRLHFADALVIPGIVAGLWYIPNIPNLFRYLIQNTGIGALEGEPPVLSFQSFIYYLRLLEGYQLFALLFAVLCLACIFLRREVRDWKFLFFTIAGGWLVMTLLRTKDPRFTLPLLGPLAVISGAWIQSWKCTNWNRVIQTGLVSLLCFQAYAANFGVSWLPKRVVLLEGYQGIFRWDWNLYLQDYFDIFGKPKREDWKQDAILQKVLDDSKKRNAQPELAIVPDLPFFNHANFTLFARMRRLPVHVSHLQSAANGIHSFDGFNYVVMTERDQGMPWTTHLSEAMNQIITGNPEVFRLIELYQLPSGDGARLYFIRGGSGSRTASAGNQDDARK
jgi:4-amino-4-deoxy-L-arabinose transferase-like glycosyltransferase